MASSRTWRKYLEVEDDEFDDEGDTSVSPLHSLAKNKPKHDNFRITVVDDSPRESKSSSSLLRKYEVPKYDFRPPKEEKIKRDVAADIRQALHDRREKARQDAGAAAISKLNASMFAASKSYTSLFLPTDRTASGDGKEKQDPLKEVREARERRIAYDKEIRDIMRRKVFLEFFLESCIFTEVFIDFMFIISFCRRKN
jgi:hypothetical protein